MDRVWAAIGNLLRVVAVISVVVAVLAAIRALDWLKTNPPTSLVLVLVGLGAAELVIALLFWFAKGPLVSGNGVVRFLAGLYMLVWCFTTFGGALILLGVVYFFTAEPETYKGIFRADEKRKKPTFAPPSNWRSTGRVGPSGAMLYSNAELDQAVGVFDSWLPVQVVDKRNGLAHVVAATGERGWIDLRQLTETA